MGGVDLADMQRLHFAIQPSCANHHVPEPLVAEIILIAFLESI
jgi:hypothetical protein